MGDRALASDCIFLDQLELEIPASPRGTRVIEVEFEMTTDWGLVVTVRDLSSEEKNAVVANVHVGRYYITDEADFLRMQAEGHAERDAVLRELWQERNAIDGRRGRRQLDEL